MVAEPPQDLEWKTVDGVFIKEILMKDSGTMIAQHIHRFDHTSFLATGAVGVWEDGCFTGNRHAPMPLFIKAGVAHSFVSLEDDTILFCIHNLHGEDYVQSVPQEAF
jgi:quercetin dioxygenase-like cupin family protein